MRQLDRVTALGVRRMEGLLREFRTEINSRLALLTGAPDDPFTLRIVPGISQEINLALEDLRLGANAEFAQRLEDAFGLGSGITSTALNAAGIPLAFPSVSPALLSTLTATTQNIFSEMTGRLGDRINQQLRLGAIGLNPTSAVMGNIANLLRTSQAVERGLRRRIGFASQAEAITRTEIGRVYSAAQQAGAEQAAQTIPDLKKRWVTRKKERRGHRAVEQATKPGEDPGPISIKAKFRVQDFSRVGRTSFLTLGKRINPPQGRVPGQRVVKTKTYTRRGRVITDRMLFPRDPKAHPGNVVNCTCTVVEFLPEMEKAVERTLGVIQRGGVPDEPPPLAPKNVDKLGRTIQRSRNPTTALWRNWSKGLSEDSKDALQLWTGGSYTEIRALQMGTFTGDPGFRRSVQDALTDLKKAMKTAPVWEGQVWRGVRNLPADLFEKWKTAGTLEFEAFSSTSTKRKVAESFSKFGTENQVLLKIKSGKGVWIRPLSLSPDEFEVLYEKGQRFRVVGRTLSRSRQGVPRLLLELEELD